MVALFFATSTLASFTPSIFDSAVRTATLQDAQVMPSTWSDTEAEPATTAPSAVACSKGKTVDVAKKSATVDYDPAKVTSQQLVDVVNRLGYQASLPAKSGS